MLQATRRGLVLALAVALAACREDNPAIEPPRALSVTDAGSRADANGDATLDAAPSGPTVDVASFNVHRLFDTVCDTGDCGPGAYEVAPSREVFDGQVARLANGIRRLRAGVVLLQEVETKGCLDALAGALPELPHAVLGETGGPASVDVAVLSAFPITEVRSHFATLLTMPDGRTTTFSRDLLEVHVSAPIGELVVFVAHFRSKVNDDPERRLEEARAARDIVLRTAAAFPTATVLLGGDLNDVPGSPPLDALAHAGPSGPSLVRVSEGLPAAEIGTNYFGGGWVAIDHFFLARHAVGRAVPGSFQVFREVNEGWGGSDHGAIRATFAR